MYMREEKIQDLQREIDDVDEKLLSLVQLRFMCSREIGVLKRLGGQPPFDPGRVNSQSRHFVERALELGLDADLANKLIEAIVAQVLRERALLL
jgi:chorismate mutase